MPLGEHCQEMEKVLCSSSNFVKDGKHLWSRVEAVLGLLQPVGSPRGISLGKTAFHSGDPQRAGTERPWRSGRDGEF